MDDPFEPDVAAALERMRAAGRPPFETLTVAEARALYRAGRDTVQLAPIDLDEVEDIDLAGRPARRYRPAKAAPGTILFLHGGGYVIGDLDTHDGICRHLAVAANAQVIALDYRLAPEHPFPAAFDDCAAALRALGNGAPVAVSGDSAGGTLALAIALAAERRPAGLALFYPVGDIAAEAPSYARVRGVPISGATMRWFWDHTCAARDRSDWRISPLRAPSFEGLPPTFVTTAGYDPLSDEGRALVARLRANGVAVEHRELPGQIHGYLTLGRLIGEAERSIAAAGRFLSDQLRAGPSASA